MSSLFLPACSSQNSTHLLESCSAESLINYFTCYTGRPLFHCPNTVIKVDHSRSHFSQNALLVDSWFGSLPISVDPLLVLRPSLLLTLGTPGLCVWPLFCLHSLLRWSHPLSTVFNTTYASPPENKYYLLKNNFLPIWFSLCDAHGIIKPKLS